MHIRSLSKPAIRRPSYASEDWGVYEHSWMYLFLFLIAAVLVPGKV